MIAWLGLLCQTSAPTYCVRMWLSNQFAQLHVEYVLPGADVRATRAPKSASYIAAEKCKEPFAGQSSSRIVAFAPASSPAHTERYTSRTCSADRSHEYFRTSS